MKRARNDTGGHCFGTIGSSVEEEREMADFEILTFDCYGTLVDWRSGIVEAFVEVARELGRSIDSDRVLELHARFEPEIQAGDFRSYREVLDLTAERICAEIGIDLAGEGRRFLSQSLPDWPPFADTGPALMRLRAAGYRLGILSNVDDDLLAATCKHLPVEFDLLVTAEQVGSYKPAPAHFLETRRRIGDASWLHVAQSFFHDVEPAVTLQLPVVWINRQQEAPLSEARPTAEFFDLQGFARQMVGGGGPRRS